jgi:predicted nucleic acid-binding protein
MMTLTAVQPIRVYADTSVYGGVFDDEFAKASRAFFDRIRDGSFHLVVSALVEDELAQAPLEVRDWFGGFRAEAGSVKVTDEALALQQAYLDAGIVTPKSIDDALHVALATVGRCGLIVSWNFRHIVHYQKVPLQSRSARRLLLVASAINSIFLRLRFASASVMLTA